MRSDTNKAVKSQKQARCLKFCVFVQEELYCPSSENKDAFTGQLICAFEFVYADCWFSDAASQLLKVIIRTKIPEI